MNKSREELSDLALEIRRDIIKMTYSAGANGGHIGGALSAADIFAVLYGHVMNISPENAEEPNRDRFILSKGHVSLAHYATLAECGFIRKDDLESFEKAGSAFSTHEDMMIDKGIEISSGSLGYGLSIGVGCALAAKLDGRNNKVYVLAGDGECEEGTIWESIMSAVQFKLDNLVFVIDVNKQQLDGYTNNIIEINDLKAVIRGFGCNCIEVNGHDIDELIAGLDSSDGGVPTVIIANTVKGKGVSSIEGVSDNHHMRIDEEQYIQYLKELEE